MEINKNAVSINISRYRIMAKISQKELSKRTGLNASYISDLENKKGKLPSMEALSKIATALNTNVDKLIYENLIYFVSDKQEHDTLVKELQFLTEAELRLILSFLKVYGKNKSKLCK